MYCISTQYLRQFTEVALVDVSSDAVVGLVHVLANKIEGIGHSQQRKQLVLLRLVIDDLGLWLPAGQKHAALSFQFLFDKRGCGKRSNNYKNSAISICCWNNVSTSKCTNKLLLYTKHGTSSYAIFSATGN